MRRRAPCVPLVVALALVTACQHARSTPLGAPAPAVGPEEQLARSFVDDLAAGRWQQAERSFDARMARAMPADRIAAFWQGRLANDGAWGGIERASTEADGPFTVVALDARFARRPQRLRVTVSRDGRIAGLFHGPVPSDAERIAVGVVRALSSDDAAAAVADFDARMRDALPPDKALEAWRSIERKAGALRAVENVTSRSERGAWVVRVACRMERSAVVTTVVFDADGDVAGLFFSSEPPAEWSPPPYVDAGAFEEHEVSVGSDPPLPGTLALPVGASPVAAVVLVHGSGPSDRDETIGGTKVFRDLALGLASRKIASLRYDKRTLVDPRGVTTEKEEVLDGALAAIRLLRATARIDPASIVVVGHSQGAALAPRIAEIDGHLAGIALLAAPARPIEVVTLAQAEYLGSLSPGDEGAQRLVVQARDFVKDVESPDLRPDTLVVAPGGGRVRGAYFLAARGYHPETLAASLACPVLVLQGGRDYQVTVRDDFEVWRGALAHSPRASLQVYPELDHRFVAGHGPSSPVEYRVAAHVDERVVDELASWIAGLRP
jgi:uncharacterized protein